MNENATSAPAPAAPPAASGGVKRLLVLGLMLGLASVGGGYVTTLRAPARPEKTHEPPGLGPTLALDTFIVNLNEPSGMRYLKLAIELEVAKTPTEQGAGLALRVRDQMIVYLSTLKVADVQQAETKEKIKGRLLEIAKAVYGKEQIKAVFFKEMVIQ
jgi:flagellar basal body-associated protein FliL